MNNETFEMVAKTLYGLEEILAGELLAIGANDIEIGRRMVSFTGDKEVLYRANFCCRTALRILKPIYHFKAKDADTVYKEVKKVVWENYMSLDKTFAIDSVIYSEDFNHSKFVAYRTKDAIVDYFMEKHNKRPSVRVNNPDLYINIHISHNDCTLSIDSSGESLHKRGYRVEQTEAPLNEVLAAGMILMTGWNGECDLIDPMCGSGTIPIEAALIARNIAPGVFRKEFAFEKWVDFDQDLFDTIYNDDSQEREFTHKIYGYDNSPQANEIATRNIKAAGVSKDVTLKLQPFQQFEQPAEKSIIITNPPYGERISTNDLLGLYSMIGERLKHAFTGNTAWILSYREECFDQIGLKPTTKIPLFNGALECEFRQYEIFDGKYKEFREGGDELSKEPKELKLASGERREVKTRERREFSGERREYSGERRPREFNGERRPREFNSGEKREFRPREGRDFKDGERRDFKPREYRKPADGERSFRGGDRNFRDREDRKPRGESYPERKRRESKEKGEE